MLVIVINYVDVTWRLYETQAQAQAHTHTVQSNTACSPLVCSISFFCVYSLIRLPSYTLSVFRVRARECVHCVCTVCAVYYKQLFELLYGTIQMTGTHLFVSVSGWGVRVVYSCNSSWQPLVHSYTFRFFSHQSRLSFRRERMSTQEAIVHNV